MENNKGQVSSVEYAILGLVILSVIVSGVSIAITPSVPKNVTTQKDLKSLQSNVNQLESRVSKLEEGQSTILNKIGAKVARISVTSINVPSQLTVGQTENVSALVTNTGKKKGTETIEFTVEGKTIDTREVSVGPGETKTVEFQFMRNEEGTYDLNIGGAAASIKVVPGAPKKPIKVGIMYPATGFMAAEGHDQLRTCKLLVNEINRKGGLLGRPIKIFVEDTESSPKATVKKMKRLIIRDDVCAVIGGISTAVAQAGKKVAQKEKIPYMTFSGSTTVVRPPNLEYYFHPNHNHGTLTSVAPAIAERYGTDWYFIGSDYSYGHDGVEKVKRALRKSGIEYTNLGTTFVPTGTKDFSTQISKIKETNPDVIYSVNVGGSYAAFVKQALASGVEAKIYCDYTNIHVIKAIGSRAAGQVMAPAEGTADNPLYSGEIDPMNKFLQKYKERYGVEGSPQLVNAAWHGMKFFFKAVRKAGSAKPKEIRDALEGLKLENNLMTPKAVRLRELDHQMTEPMFLMVAREKNGKMVFATEKAIKLDTVNDLLITKEEWQKKYGS